MINKKYVIREFTVCTRIDSNNLLINCTTYIAKMYNDFTVLVNDKLYTNNDFNNKFSVNIP